MSEEYNRYDLGNDPEEKSETPETTAAQRIHPMHFLTERQEKREKTREMGNLLPELIQVLTENTLTIPDRIRIRIKILRALTAPTIFLPRFPRNQRRK